MPVARDPWARSHVRRPVESGTQLLATHSEIAFHLLIERRFEIDIVPAILLPVAKLKPD
jgi:hypothetical protein